MNCPKCSAPMAEDKFKDYSFHRCTGCAGLWLEMGELTAFRHMDGAEAIDTGNPEVGHKMNATDHIKCPACTTPMIRMVDNHHPHIWYEGCTVCYGVFLDAGELKELKSESPIGWLKDWFAHTRL